MHLRKNTDVKRAYLMLSMLTVTLALCHTSTAFRLFAGEYQQAVPVCPLTGEGSSAQL